MTKIKFHAKKGQSPNDLPFAFDFDEADELVTDILEDARSEYLERFDDVFIHVIVGVVPNEPYTVEDNDLWVPYWNEDGERLPGLKDGLSQFVEETVEPDGDTLQSFAELLSEYDGEPLRRTGELGDPFQPVYLFEKIYDDIRDLSYGQDYGDATREVMYEALAHVDLYANNNKTPWTIKSETAVGFDEEKHVENDRVRRVGFVETAQGREYRLVILSDAPYRVYAVGVHEEGFDVSYHSDINPLRVEVNDEAYDILGSRPSTDDPGEATSTPSVDERKTEALKDLQTIRGIGKTTATDLYNAGYTSLDALHDGDDLHDGAKDIINKSFHGKSREDLGLSETPQNASDSTESSETGQTTRDDDDEQEEANTDESEDAEPNSESLQSFAELLSEYDGARLGRSGKSRYGDDDQPRFFFEDVQSATDVSIHVDGADATQATMYEALDHVDLYVNENKTPWTLKSRDAVGFDYENLHEYKYTRTVGFVETEQGRTYRLITISDESGKVYATGLHDSGASQNIYDDLTPLRVEVNDEAYDILGSRPSTDEEETDPVQVSLSDESDDESPSPAEWAGGKHSTDLGGKSISDLLGGE